MRNEKASEHALSASSSLTLLSFLLACPIQRTLLLFLHDNQEKLQLFAPEVRPLQEEEEEDADDDDPVRQ